MESRPERCWRCRCCSPTSDKGHSRSQTRSTTFVVRNLDGTAKGDGQASWVMGRICRRAGLPVRYWHTLRHGFGTHAALFGVNPWRLQTWMGHKRIDETMLYVHVAEAHARELPEPVREATSGVVDPDARIVAMLGARGRKRKSSHIGCLSRARRGTRYPAGLAKREPARVREDPATLAKRRGAWTRAARTVSARTTRDGTKPATEGGTAGTAGRPEGAGEEPARGESARRGTRTPTVLPTSTSIQRYAVISLP
ncbi:MAG: tyrosine-type recombinase/integrase [Deltaproteobacteria bacterium]|nr:tyrosine-type recombinase/integrase [Deltaproteobacteria bacterium]